MTLERRDGRLYYYRSVRDGEKVRKVYVGAGEFARISSETDMLRRTGRRAQRERAELERLEALVAPVEEFSDAAKILVIAHLVDGGTANTKESGDVHGALELSEDARGRLTELRTLSEKAEAGDKEARKELRRLLRASSPEVIAEASDIARRAEGMLVKTISAGKPLMQEALEERMHQMRAEIAGENPTPLEDLLTERVVAGWLLVEVLEGLIAAQYQRDVKAHRVAPTYVIQQSRILESATRRYLAAIRELARVRKLQAGTPVQVNTQVNVLRG